MKYREQEDAAEYLKNKLKSGSTGVWGEIPMPPQIALKPEDSDKLVAAILGLSEGMSETSGSLEGSLKLAPKYDVPTGGAWEISAEAPGYSPAKLRIAAE